jgi:hypothetical protein
MKKHQINVCFEDGYIVFRNIYGELLWSEFSDDLTDFPVAVDLTEVIDRKDKSVDRVKKSGKFEIQATYKCGQRTN